MRRAFAFVVFGLFAVVSIFSENPINSFDLSFGENIEQPVIGKKAAVPIKEHMKQISTTLSKHFKEVSLQRNGEVVMVAIPCSSLFYPNKSELKESGKKYLRPFLNLLKYPTMYKIVVAVHSDNTGEEDYRFELTDARASAIDDFLCSESEEQGENVIPYGLGSEEPLVSNNSIQDRAKNRRVELYIIPEYQMIERAKSGKLN